MDKVSKAKRSEIMRHVKSKETKLEISLRKSLWLNGIKYRKNNSKHFGKPDLLFKSKRLVVFIDSCFWHGCPKHLRMPVSRQEYWINKINKNKKRDKQVSLYYRERRWKMIRIWEHELLSSIDQVVDRIKKDLLST